MWRLGYTTRYSWESRLKDKCRWVESVTREKRDQKNGMVVWHVFVLSIHVSVSATCPCVCKHVLVSVKMPLCLLTTDGLLTVGEVSQKQTVGPLQASCHCHAWHDVTAAVAIAVAVVGVANFFTRPLSSSTLTVCVHALSAGRLGIYLTI